MIGLMLHRKLERFSVFAALLVASFALATSFALTTAVAQESGDAAEDSASPFAPAIAAAQQRTVKIYGGAIGKQVGYGSGIIVSKDGQIVTARTAILAANHLRVGLPDGTVHSAEVVRTDNTIHLALLKIDADTENYFDLTTPANVAVGDWVVAVTNAFKVADGKELLSATLGVVSAKTRQDVHRGLQGLELNAELLVYDAITSNPGSDGGAVVDTEGKLAGMVGRLVESDSTGTRLNYAIPAAYVKAFVEGRQIAESTDVPEAKPASLADLGVRLFSIGGKRSPPFVDRISGTSRAGKAGLQPDDLIVAVGGKTTRSIAEVEAALAELPGNMEILLSVKRDSRVQTIRIAAE